jgi:hypothetical protein
MRKLIVFRAVSDKFDLRTKGRITWEKCEVFQKKTPGSAPVNYPNLGNCGHQWFKGSSIKINCFPHGRSTVALSLIRTKLLWALVCTCVSSGVNNWSPPNGAVLLSVSLLGLNAARWIRNLNQQRTIFSGSFWLTISGNDRKNELDEHNFNNTPCTISSYSVQLPF